MDEPPEHVGRYRRIVGSHAPALVRLLVAVVVGIVVLALVALFGEWPLPLLAGWDATAFVLLSITMHLIYSSDAPATRQHAQRDDETKGTARLLVLLVSMASLLGVGWALHTAKDAGMSTRIWLLALSVLTVVLSWIVVNGTFTLHYAHLYYETAQNGITFPDTESPAYRDLAYVAFTIGMTYQVSDTALRTPAMRRAVLHHSLVSYVFGVVIVATTVNILATYL